MRDVKPPHTPPTAPGPAAHPSEGRRVEQGVVRVEFPSPAGAGASAAATADVAAWGARFTFPLPVQELAVPACHGGMGFVVGGFLLGLDCGLVAVSFAYMDVHLIYPCTNPSTTHPRRSHPAGRRTCRACCPAYGAGAGPSTCPGLMSCVRVCIRVCWFVGQERLNPSTQRPPQPHNPTTLQPQKPTCRITGMPPPPSPTSAGCSPAVTSPVSDPLLPLRLMLPPPPPPSIDARPVRLPTLFVYGSPPPPLPPPRAPAMPGACQVYGMERSGPVSAQPGNRIEIEPRIPSSTDDDLHTRTRTRTHPPSRRHSAGARRRAVSPPAQRVIPPSSSRRAPHAAHAYAPAAVRTRPWLLLLL